MTNKLKSFFLKTKFQAMFLFVFLFLIYLINAPKDIVGYGWSDDFIRSGVLGSSLKAPQFFVLQTFIGFVSYLLPFLTARSIGYGLASFLGAGTVGFLYLIYSEFEEIKNFPIKKINPIYKFASGISLAFSYYFFTQSLIIERYVLVVFLLSMLTYLSIRMRKEGLRWIRLLYLAGLSVGILYHWMFLLFGVFEFIYFLKKGGYKKIGLTTIYYMVLGILFIYILLKVNLATYSPKISYSFVRENTLSSLVSLYKETYFSEGFDNLLVYDKRYIKDFAVNAYGAHLQSFGYVSIFISLMGLGRLISWMMLDEVKKYLWMVLGIFLSLLMVSGISPVGENLEIYILSIIIFQVFSNIFLWVGMSELSRRLLKASKALDSIFFYRMVPVLILMLVLGYPALKYKSANFNNVLAGPFSRDVLYGLDEDGYIICFNDEICSSLIYIQQVEGVRKDVTIIPYWYNPKYLSLDLSSYRVFEYEDYPYILHELVSGLLADESVSLYSVGVSSSYWDFFGFDSGFIHYTPLGYYGKLSLTTPKKLPLPNYPHLSFESDPSVRDPLKTQFISNLIQNRIMNGIIYFRSEETSRGYNELNETSALAYKLHPSEFNYFLQARNSAERETVSPFFVNSFELESVDRITKEAYLFLDNKLHGNAIKLIRGAMMLDPYNVNIRLMAAEIYKESKIVDLALKEYENVLILDEGNEDALRGMLEIKESM